MTKNQIDDKGLIKYLRAKLKEVEKQQGALSRQHRLLSDTLESIISVDSNKATETKKTKKLKSTVTKQAKVVEAVVQLSEKKSGPVTITEILADLKEKGIGFDGKTNVKTRISGILNREAAQNGKARVKRVGRGQYEKI